MRMSSWTPDVIRFMEDASSHTPYFDEIAAAVLRHAGSTARVCDAGCGMGQLAFALAPHAGRVDAVDRSPRAIAYVRAQAEARGLRTVRPRRADVASLRPAEPYDLMVFSLSASLEDAWAAARGRCRGTLVVINKMHGAPPDPDARRPRVHGLERSLRGLRALGIPCAGEALDLEFGQPFRSLEDAAAYARATSPPAPRAPTSPGCSTRRATSASRITCPCAAASPSSPSTWAPSAPSPPAPRSRREAGVIGAAGRRRPFAAGR